MSPSISPQLLAKIRKARRRLNVSRFLFFAVWSIVIAMSVAAVVVALATRYGWPVSPIWAVAGAAGSALIVASIATWATARNLSDAAAELDNAFGLKERL